MRTSISCRLVARWKRGLVRGAQVRGRTKKEKPPQKGEVPLQKFAKKNMQIYAEKESSASPLVDNVQAASHDSSHPSTLVFSTSFALCVTGDPWMTAGVS